MRRHRTTARGVLFLLLLTAVAGGAAASTEAGGPTSSVTSKAAGGTPIVFPIVGASEYSDDYGDPRPNGRHAGIDILTTWRSAAVAAEDGKVKFWTTSARAGCLLYLYGASGTTYLYIHLNNDLTRRHDNRGGCVPGVAYAETLENGARVKAGQLIGYNGDSGDAEGTYHLHFEVHPNGGPDVNPRTYLDAAVRTLFPLPAHPSRKVVLGLRGSQVSAGGGVLELALTEVRVWPGGRWTQVSPRTIELTVPASADLDATIADQLLSPSRRSLASRKAPALTVFTTLSQTTPEILRGDARALTVERVRVVTP
jgi:hypothetical protein